MRKICLTAFIALVSAFCIISCSKAEKQALPDVLILSPSEKSVISSGADIQVKFTANYPVSAACEASWVHPVMGEGSCLVSVDEYKGDVIRTTEVVFTTDKGARAVFSLTQFSAEQEDTINIDPHEADVSEKGGDINVTVEAYYAVSCECTEKWVSAVSVEKGRFTVTVEPNPDAVQRSAEVVFTTTMGSSDTMHITQDAADVISVDVPQKTVSADAESFEVNVTSVYDYTVSKDVDWIQVSDLGDGKYKISTEDNRVTRESRVATVSFTSSHGAVATVVVTQGGFEDNVSLSVSSVEATEYGARVSVTVTSNYAVTAAVDPQYRTWLAVSGSAFTYTVDVQRNETSQAREGYVVFTSIHGASASLKVSQKAGDAPGDGSVLPFIDIEDIDYD